MTAVRGGAALPLPQPQPASVRALRDSVRPVDSSGVWSTRNRGRALVVDDEPSLLRSLARLLRARGYVVDTATDGSSAIELVHKTNYDVLVSDITMPRMDGIQLLREVRDHDLDLPVVLMTGEPAVSTAVKALEYGAFHYLTKPIDHHDLEEVLDKAVCLYRMARMRREAAEFLNQAGVGARDRAGLEASFAKALDSLWIAYQPILRASDGAIHGYEALLRSREPSLPHPGAVLDAAERLGQMTLLGRQIRELATEPVVASRAPFDLFVNLHTTDLEEASLFDPDAPLSRIAHRVVLEITERSSLEQVRDVKLRVARLREMGFRIAVDDLGAGYAGLTSFALLEPEIVKLDMSLVRDVHTSATKQKLIRSMTSLCKDMGMLVVGEGVETREERDTLVALGCDLLQGYLFARPGPPFPVVCW